MKDSIIKVVIVLKQESLLGLSSLSNYRFIHRGIDNKQCIYNGNMRLKYTIHKSVRYNYALPVLCCAKISVRDFELHAYRNAYNEFKLVKLFDLLELS